MSLLALALEQTQHKTWLNYSANALAHSENLEEAERQERIEKMLATIRKGRKAVCRAWIVRQSGLSERRATQLIDELVRTRRIIPTTSAKNRTSWHAGKN